MNTSKLRHLPTLFAIALFAIATQWVLTQPLTAQDTTVATDVADSGAVASDQEKSLIDMYKAGGWAMYPLTLLSIGGFGLIVYNFMAVRPEPILNTEATVQIDEALGKLDIQKAKTLCQENPSPATNIIEAGLNRVDINRYDPEQVKEAIEESSAEELAGPFVLINYLSVVGSLSPMVGLLGTVSGMVKAFNVIEAEGAGSAQALAGNISEALITTATGMIIGIPAMFFFFFFKNRYGKITSRIGRVVGDLQFTLNKAIKDRA
ncbi:MAG: MotA/TolQ/ExbB proton channel family protein [Puniceicoccaceae bacterium]|nr:MAG: MotA/TolQ/ExbB proton channel family protein [Puniceicoccaceae bacterium]